MLTGSKYTTLKLKLVMKVKHYIKSTGDYHLNLLKWKTTSGGCTTIKNVNVSITRHMCQLATNTVRSQTNVC